MTDHAEARRLLAAGVKLCRLKPMSKQPEGDKWNYNLLTRPDQAVESIGGYGVPLAINGLCSVDFDNVTVAEEGLHRCGFDPEWLRGEGVATSSTRPGSGGRVAFRVPEGLALRWLRFTNKVDGTILELRAQSQNLQDCLTGTTYHDQNGGGPWVQQYSGLWTFDTAPALPEAFAAWWARMSEDIDFLHAQQQVIAGVNAQLDVSSGEKLAFSSKHRVPYNACHDVAEILEAHGYTGKRGRYRCPTASGGPGIRLIPGRDGLWQSDHASDPLFGTFDAWTANVVLNHGGLLIAAEAEVESILAVEMVEGFDEEPVGTRVQNAPAKRGIDVSPAKNLREQTHTPPTAGDDEWDETPIEQLTRRRDGVAPAGVARVGGQLVPAGASGPLAVREGGALIADDLPDADLFGDQTDKARAMVVRERMALMEVPDLDLPAFSRTKQGKIESSLTNILTAVQSELALGARVGIDQFRDELMIAPMSSDEWRPFRDADYVWLMARLQTGVCAFEHIPKEMFKDTIHAVADLNAFDSAQLWLSKLQWDGVERIDRFYTTYFQAAEAEYVRAVGAYTWTALAGRIISPGCKADMAPILHGKQGEGKSTAIAAMAPDPSLFTEVSFGEKEEAIVRKIKGVLIAELAELKGLHSSDMDYIKAFMTRQHEKWVPKYKEFATMYPRRLLFIGTTNKHEFLADETGNRRWLPMTVGTVDVEAIKRDRDQLWAEAAVRYKLGGVAWQKAKELAETVHEEFSFKDDWDAKVADWIAQPDFDEVRQEGGFDGGEVRQTGGFTASDALVGAIGVQFHQIKRADEMRMKEVLSRLGYEKDRRTIGGVRKYLYFKQ